MRNLAERFGRWLCFLSIFGPLTLAAGCQTAVSTGSQAVHANDYLRNESLQFARQIAQSVFSNTFVTYPKTLRLKGDWAVSVSLYLGGDIQGATGAQAGELAPALEAAVKDLIKNEGKKSLTEEEIKNSRFLISFSKTGALPFSFIEYHGEAKELAGDVVAVRFLDKISIREKIQAGKEYLLAAMHKDKHGFRKKYDARKGRFGNKLRTIYSASSLYTFLKISDFEKDERIDQAVPAVADFLLSMQNKTGEGAGAFYYAYDLETRQNEMRFVVGTASKTIFTLLELYRRTREAKYLESAKAAGDWLLTMRNPDGTVMNQMKYQNGAWVYERKYSNLFTGQVLSALSRLYRVTQDNRYFAAAEGLAKSFAERAERNGYFLRDDYRLADDPVPTSWAVMALLDFYKASRDESAQKVMLRCLDQLLKRQIDNPSEIKHYGRFRGTLATSGNGWINEVLSEVYLYGKAQKWPGCEKYKKAALKVTRWLIQNTYSKENTYFLKNPQRAIGGLIRNSEEEAVRTDAVCHGVNGYVNMLPEFGDGILLTVPEKRFKV